MFTRKILASSIVPLFYLFSIDLCIPVESRSVVDIINSGGVSSLEWGHHLPPAKNYLLLPENNTHAGNRQKRYITDSDGKPNEVYQACMAPGNKKGHCKHLSQCVLEDFQKNFIRYLDYMCVIHHRYVGVCCPDNSKEIAQTNPLNIENLAEFLPAVADDDEKPIGNNSVESNTTNTQSDLEGRAFGRVPRGPRGCGMSSKSRTRIVGGRPADPREWPWMAALLRDGSVQYCGGVLITDRHVLTAAHCVQGLRLREILVRLGEYDFTKSDETRALDFRVIEIKIHPDFDPANYDNDIAIIKIHRPTIFNTYIWPICLPPNGFSAENKSAIVTGWGTQYYGGPASTILMEVPVPVWSHDMCARSMVPRISRNTLCAGGYQGGRDSCQGDSGGPLVHQLANGRWVNIGIVSWGIRCGEPGHPGIYTDVSSYLDWIFTNAVF